MNLCTPIGAAPGISGVMKAVRVTTLGNPSLAACCIDMPIPSPCEPGQVLVKILASPINPADLLEIQGRYAGAKVPFIPGAEGAGRVLATGSAVKHLQIGDLVLCMARGNWIQYRVLAESELIALPAALAVEHAAMLRVNPATAQLLLSEILLLPPGDWIVFNGANSSVGRLLSQMARARGLRAIAVVRHPAAAIDLHEFGADTVLLDDDNLPSAVAQLTSGGARIAFDCVAGEPSSRLARSLRRGGTLCVYGHLSGEPCQIPSSLLTFGQVTVQGFNLGHALARKTHAQVHDLYLTLAAQFASGQLRMPVERCYGLEQIGDALAHAQASRLHGKILVVP